MLLTIAAMQFQGWGGERVPLRRLSRRRGNASCVVTFFLIQPFRPTVPTVFKCPYCNNESAVEVKLDVQAKVGDLNCRICGASYQTTITCNAI